MYRSTRPATIKGQKDTAKSNSFLITALVGRIKQYNIRESGMRQRRKIRNNWYLIAGYNKTHIRPIGVNFQDAHTIEN
jgi:hypothetical protein